MYIFKRIDSFYYCFSTAENIEIYELSGDEKTLYDTIVIGETITDSVFLYSKEQDLLFIILTIDTVERYFKYEFSDGTTTEDNEIFYPDFKPKNDNYNTESGIFFKRYPGLYSPYFLYCTNGIAGLDIDTFELSLVKDFGEFLQTPTSEHQITGMLNNGNLVMCYLGNDEGFVGALNSSGSFKQEDITTNLYPLANTSDGYIRFLDTDTEKVYRYDGTTIEEESTLPDFTHITTQNRTINMHFDPGNSIVIDGVNVPSESTLHYFNTEIRANIELSNITSSSRREDMLAHLQYNYLFATTNKVFFSEPITTDWRYGSLYQITPTYELITNDQSSKFGGEFTHFYTIGSNIYTFTYEYWGIGPIIKKFDEDFNELASHTIDAFYRNYYSLPLHILKEDYLYILCLNDMDMGYVLTINLEEGNFDVQYEAIDSSDYFSLISTIDNQYFLYENNNSNTYHLLDPETFLKTEVTNNLPAGKTLDDLYHNHYNNKNPLETNYPITNFTYNMLDDVS